MPTAAADSLTTTLTVSLGVESDVQIGVGDGDRALALVIPTYEGLGLGTRVVSVLTLGARTERVEGVVAWLGETAGPRFRRRPAVGLSFPTLNAAQTTLLTRARLLHESAPFPFAGLDGQSPEHDEGAEFTGGATTHARRRVGRRPGEEHHEA